MSEIGTNCMEKSGIHKFLLMKCGCYRIRYEMNIVSNDDANAWNEDAIKCGMK